MADPGLEYDQEDISDILSLAKNLEDACEDARKRGILEVIHEISGSMIGEHKLVVKTVKLRG